MLFIILSLQVLIHFLLQMMHYEFLSVNLDKSLQRKRWRHTKRFFHLELKDKLAKEMAAEDCA